MSDENSKLKEKVKELEEQLQKKTEELDEYRLEIRETNKHLEKIITQINHEVQMAAQIQKILSPTEIPRIQGFDFSTKFLPGTQSGGDYFDIFEHEDKMKFGIVLSSCSGYTMSALFLSILIKISSKVEARKGLEPDQMISLIAKEMITQMQVKDQVSLFYGIVDKRNYEFKYSSLGKTHAYLQVFGQDSLVSLDPCGPQITKDFNAQPKSLTIQLNPRDRWVLCSDGLLREINSQNQVYGLDRFKESIRSAPKQGVHELRNEIFYQIEKFTGRVDPSHDSTLVVIEVKDRVIKLARQ